MMDVYGEIALNKNETAWAIRLVAIRRVAAAQRTGLPAKQMS
jgi:hypothetical protein